MDFANRGGNRPLQQQPAPQREVNSVQAPQSNNKKGIEFGKISAIFVLIGGAIVAATLIVALVFGGKATTSKEASLINTDRYQAVFLNSQDGQVYFGKLAVYNSSLYVLSDIYYVRVENPIQPEGANQQQQPNISLAKLGSELHGPEDVMFISRDKVLYWENLKNEGQVVTAITEFKKNGGNTTQQDANQQTNQTQQTTGTEQQNTPAETPATTP